MGNIKKESGCINFEQKLIRYTFFECSQYQPLRTAIYLKLNIQKKKLKEKDKMKKNGKKMNMK